MARDAVERNTGRYDSGMDAARARRVKVTVTLSPERAERARKAVEFGFAPSLSAWIEDALDLYEQGFGWEEGAADEALEMLDRKYGPVPEEVKRWAEQVLQGL